MIYMGNCIRSVFLFALLALFVVVLLSACSGSRDSRGEGDGVLSQVEDLFNGLTGGGMKSTVKEDPDAPYRNNEPRVLENTADGMAVFDGNGAVVDFSNVADGYIMARYEGDNPKVKIQITRIGGSTYTYDVAGNKDFAGFPLSDGNGIYSIAMFLNIENDTYSQACAQEVHVDITDEFSPFLRPNQYSNFTSGTLAVAKASEIAEGAKGDLKVIENVFMHIAGNVKYDYEKAETVQSGYFPNVDDTLLTSKGICFDFASLMTCMLRSQGIPCKLVVGYAGTTYHAWISVYIQDIGWVANMIQFNGDTWTLMDPTFAASGDRADPNLVGDGKNYNPVYHY